MARKQRFDWLLASIVVGIILLLLGMQLRAVEQFVCAPWSTKILAQWFGGTGNGARDAIERMVVESGTHRHVIAPPAWCGWAALSLGFVLVANGLWAKRQRRPTRPRS